MKSKALQQGRTRSLANGGFQANRSLTKSKNLSFTRVPTTATQAVQDKKTPKVPAVTTTDGAKRKFRVVRSSVPASSATPGISPDDSTPSPPLSPSQTPEIPLSTSTSHADPESASSSTDISQFSSQTASTAAPSAPLHTAVLSSFPLGTISHPLVDSSASAVPSASTTLNTSVTPTIAATTTTAPAPQSAFPSLSTPLSTPITEASTTPVPNKKRPTDDAQPTKKKLRVLTRPALSPAPSPSTSPASSPPGSPTLSAPPSPTTSEVPSLPALVQAPTQPIPTLPITESVQEPKPQLTLVHSTPPPAPTSPAPSSSPFVVPATPVATPSKARVEITLTPLTPVSAINTSNIDEWIEEEERSLQMEISASHEGNQSAATTSIAFPSLDTAAHDMSWAEDW